MFRRAAYARAGVLLFHDVPWELTRPAALSGDGAGAPDPYAGGLARELSLMERKAREQRSWARTHGMEAALWSQRGCVERAACPV